MKTRAGAAGYTLFEMMIVITLLTVVILAIMGAVRDGQRFSSLGIETAYQQERVQKALDRIAEDLMNSNLAHVTTTMLSPLGPDDTLAAGNAVTSFSFQSNAGYDPDTSTVIWNNPVTYSWEDSVTFAPLGNLVRTAPDGTTEILLTKVQVNGFRVGNDNGEIMIELLTSTEIDDLGEFETKLSTSVAFKN